MKFPTIPHNIPLKTFGEVFNRLLNVYLLENESFRERLCWWGDVVLKSQMGQNKKKTEDSGSLLSLIISTTKKITF